MTRWDKTWILGCAMIAGSLGNGSAAGAISALVAALTLLGLDALRRRGEGGTTKEVKR